MSADTHVDSAFDIKAAEDLAPLREFLIPFKIEGKLKVFATDMEGARYLAEHISEERYAAKGLLETFEPEAVQ